MQGLSSPQKRTPLLPTNENRLKYRQIIIRVKMLLLEINRNLTKSFLEITKNKIFCPPKTEKKIQSRANAADLVI